MQNTPIASCYEVGAVGDFEYDEAHEIAAGSLPPTPAPHRVDAPTLVLDQGGDYGYDEAHDFGAR